jgi:hypothetical protein
MRCQEPWGITLAAGFSAKYLPYFVRLSGLQGKVVAASGVQPAGAEAFRRDYAGACIAFRKRIA